MSIETFYRDSWVEIRLDAIKQNIKAMQEHLPQGKNIYAVVKANAYGHGDIQVAKAALDAGVKGLAVSLLDEALRLRESGITAPILVMGWIRPQDVPVAIENDITVTVFQREWITEVKSFLDKKVLAVHLKLDTGMGRIGIRDQQEMIEVLEELKDERFQLTGLFTHFATADEKELSYFQTQQERFNQLLHVFEQNWTYPIMIHTGNSAAGMRFPNKMHHFVRFGISMYGLYPSEIVKQEQPIPLKPAFSLHSKLIHVKRLPEGEGVSYGKTYQTSDDEWIGTVPLGYADGWIRKLQGAHVLIDGKRFPIIGRICMDQFMVRLDKSYPIGTKVTLIGSQQGAEITMDDIAAHLNTINYEIPCLISYRVPRIYMKDEKVIKVDNSLL